MDTKITDYVVVSKNNIDRLLSEVNRMISVGWQPYGQLIMKDFHGGALHQPMVKYADEKIFVESTLEQTVDYALVDGIIQDMIANNSEGCQAIKSLFNGR